MSSKDNKARVDICAKNHRPYRRGARKGRAPLDKPWSAAKIREAGSRDRCATTAFHIRGSTVRCTGARKEVL